MSELPTSVTIGGRVFKFPHIGLVPRSSQEEYDALKASIIECGIVEPVVVSDTGDVINGHTRLIIAAELELKLAEVPLVDDMSYDDREEAETAAVLSNSVRREFTRERRLATVKTLFELEWSQRRIGRALGVGPGQVHYDLVHLGLVVKQPPADGQVEAPSPAGRSNLNGPAAAGRGEENSQADDVAPAAADPVPPAGADDSPWVFPSPSEVAAALAGGQTLPASPPAKPREEKTSTPQPEESPSERRERLLQRIMDLTRSIARVASDLRKFDLFSPPLQTILQTVDDIQKGKA